MRVREDGVYCEESSISPGTFSMFDSKEILFISPNVVKGFSVRDGEATERVSLSWTPENIERVLGTVRAAMGRNVRLLVGEPFSYVTTLRLREGETDASSKEERLEVLHKAEKLIPEELNRTAWDYRELSLPDVSRDTFVQVVALVASFARIVIPAIKTSGFHVHSTLPESCALALLFADRKEPILLIHKSEGFFVAGVFQGVVFSSITSFGAITFEAIDAAGRFLAEQCALPPKTIIFSGPFSQADLTLFERERAERAGFSVEFSENQAIFGLAKKEDVSGEDRLSLSIELDVPKTGEALPSEKDDSEKSGSKERFRPHVLDERTADDRATMKKSPRLRFSRRTMALAALFVGVLLCGGGAIFFLKKEEAREKNVASQTVSIETTIPKNGPQPVDSVVPPISPEETPASDTTSSEEKLDFNRASFRIAIENGSGTSGAAGTLNEKLSDEGFVILSIGNAVTREAKSLIRAKASVPKAFLDELLSVASLSVSPEYRFDISEKNEQDVILILGKDFSL